MELHKDSGELRVIIDVSYASADEFIDFIENENDILNGNFKTSLLKKSKYSPQISDIIKISVEKIYESKEVIEKEAAGYNIIKKLLDTFISCVNRNYEGKTNSYDKLILKLFGHTLYALKHLN